MAFGVWRWRLKRKGEEFEDVPQVVNERDEIRTPFLLGTTFTTFGRSRKVAPIDDSPDLQAIPFEYRPGAPTSEFTSEEFQSTEYTQSTATYDLPSGSEQSQRTESTASDTKTPSSIRPSPSGATSEGLPPVAESNTGEGSQVTGTGDAAFWRREAEVLRQELEELARLPGELPPGYSPGPNDS